MKEHQGQSKQGMTRRDLLGGAAGLAAASVGGFALGSAASRSPREAAAAELELKGNIRHSLPHWCFSSFGEQWDLDETCQVAKELGCESVELIGADDLPTVAEYDLACAMVQLPLNPPFVRGFNNPDNHERLIEMTRETIDAAAEYGHPNVICFTGYQYHDPDNPDSGIISPEDGLANCVEGLKQVIGYAEEHNVNLCIENLNSRDGSYIELPDGGEAQMRGHPGYQGDTADYCMAIVRAVGSPNMKILYDLYHSQIMEGDIIQRIREYGEHIGHIHTAGVPGRHELDGEQEMNYPPIMQALLDIGYEGYVGHEFIPTRDPRESLRAAIQLCDV
ncbi:MAG: hydroxypyruvate isomerase family protein [Candidatus Hydrogenedentota bacterium]